jgi:aspartate racemase
MKTIGMIGGMSWESSIEYYRITNEIVKEKLGGLHSAKSLMYSVDFAEIESLQHANCWEEATQAMITAARHLEAGSADFVVICTNTMHKMADDVESAIGIPLLHIADATADAIKAQGLTSIGLLGTRFTMEEDFYRGRLVEKHGLDVIIPDVEDRETIHRVIYDELVLGEIKTESREAYKKIIEKLIAEGAQGIVLGCTEIGLLVKEEDSPVPVFDTAYIHAVTAVEYALS